MSTGHTWRKEHAARELVAHLKTRAVEPLVDSSEPIEEADRTKWRRRLQQKRCLHCGARALAPGGSYFCIQCKPNWRYCSTCETLRTAIDHGRDSRCKVCSNIRATRQYHADKDRTLYRLRLQALSKREHPRSDQIFAAIRRRIALAELVRQTPGMSWEKRGRLVNSDPTYLAEAYRKQCRGDVRDADVIDRKRRRYLDSH